MKTEIINNSPESISKAAQMLCSGGLVAFPTETVYGLGANALIPEAVDRIFIAKGRPNNNPLIVHVADIEAMDKLCYITYEAGQLIEKFCPGPLTLLLKKKYIIPSNVNAGLENVAIRIPSHPTALSLLKECSCPIAAPSANLSGSPSPTSAKHVYKDLKGKIPLIIDGGDCEVGLESTVINLSTKPFTILRPGGISVEMIRKLFPDTIVSNNVLNPVEKNEVAESPGMMYKHYAPKAMLTLVEGNYNYVNKACISLAEKSIADGHVTKILCFEEHLHNYPDDLCLSLGMLADLNEVANGLYAKLRRLDELGIDVVYSEVPNFSGIGLALMNRLIRAAGFRKINACEYLENAK